MKRVAEHEPVIRIAEVVEPIQISLALGVVPPNIAGLTEAIESAFRCGNRIHRIASEFLVESGMLLADGKDLARNGILETNRLRPSQSLVPVPIT